MREDVAIWGKTNRTIRTEVPRLLARERSSLVDEQTVGRVRLRGKIDLQRLNNTVLYRVSRSAAWLTAHIMAACVRVLTVGAHYVPFQRILASEVNWTVRANDTLRLSTGKTVHELMQRARRNLR